MTLSYMTFFLISPTFSFLFRATKTLSLLSLHSHSQPHPSIEANWGGTNNLSTATVPPPEANRH